VHVIALIWCDEVISGHIIAGEIGCQFCIRPDVGDGIGIGEVVGTSHVVEIYEWIMFGMLLIDGGKGHVCAADILLIGLPCDAGLLQQCYKVVGRSLMVGVRIQII